MQVYVVLIERDGETTQVPGERSTEIIRQELRFAARTIEEVWTRVQESRLQPEETLIGIYEEHPAIIVIEGEDDGNV